MSLTHSLAGKEDQAVWSTLSRTQELTTKPRLRDWSKTLMGSSGSVKGAAAAPSAAGMQSAYQKADCYEIRPQELYVKAMIEPPVAA